MPTPESVARTGAGLASELRVAVMRLRRRLANERDPDNDLSIPVMAVLGALFRHGELTVGELAALERVQPPTMTRKVTFLEQGRYVVRGPHESDGRVVVVTLTERGRARVVADRNRRDEWLARRLQELTAPEREVLRAAAPLLHRLSESD